MILFELFVCEHARERRRIWRQIQRQISREGLKREGGGQRVFVDHHSLKLQSKAVCLLRITITLDCNFSET